ncbi:type II toxin-antitoxin system CcdA family antitoxin [Geomonas subterranea]|uniref:Type II toxin-antitoxin system CcdA family antitoxin n=1 Tax=Geomonas subterranea TaxID=2847989 RepID=A0ABX8LB99_9BACT|nr:type II toxin-antitoxin system CcdA family antitoxin [Geomonas subterranea]QXE89283.1 type II toxin-antitoxin system CcdA family antitoxin [Geomonas subterranea]QXM08604.1 type II toxin-antitoxin system CcdA family antitoxin [Geomonas subterranea]
MQVNLFDPDAPKKSTNLSINSDLLRQAKERRINLSQALEGRLAEMLREDYYLHWNEENKDAIDDYNRRVDNQGTFSDGRRRF